MRTNNPDTFRLREDGKWVDKTYQELFGGKRVVIFGLPGAFTPTCSKSHLPMFEELYDEIKDLGIDEIYCVSVNDAFVMDAWAEKLGVTKVKMLPDGNGFFTKQMGQLVDRSELGFGVRSWRYSMVMNSLREEVLFEEPYTSEEADPYTVSKAEHMINYLKGELENVEETSEQD